MSLPPYRKMLTLIATIASFTSAVASAKLEQIMLPINPENKKVTFTFYHFDSSKSATLTDIVDSLSKTVKQQHNTAAISSSAQSSFTYQSGKFVFSTSTSYFIKDGAIASPATSRTSSKFTFILTDEKGRHAICYAPIVNKTELGYALEKYIKDSKVKFTAVVITDSGNQCCFYKSNGNYHPYYLKELKKPAKALIVK